MFQNPIQDKLSYPVSLGPSWLWKFYGHSWFWYPWSFLGLLVRYFVEFPLRIVWGFSHKTVLISIWRKSTRVKCHFHYTVSWVLCSFARAAITEYCSLSGLTQDFIFSQFWRTDIWDQRVSSMDFIPKAFLFGLKMVVFSFCLYMLCSLCVFVLVSPHVPRCPLLLRGHLSDWIRAHPKWHCLNLITFFGLYYFFLFL